jgi:hypothetical protein
VAALTDKAVRKAARDWRKVRGTKFAPDVADLEWYLRGLRLLAAEAVARDGNVFTHSLV